MTTLTALSLKQDAFVTTYLANGGNATQAYIDAGYKHRNENVAASGASHLLQTVKISQEIATRKRIAATIASRNEVVDHAWVVAEQLDMYRDSRANDDRNAASRALDALAKLCDLYPRHDAQVAPSSVTNVVNLLADASPSDVLALFRGGPPALPPGSDDIGRGAVEHMSISDSEP